MTASKLVCYYQNVGGIKTGYRCVIDAVRLCSYDVIVLTETWLNCNLSEDEIKFDNYNVFRCDRSPSTSSKSEGGGVLIAVHKRLNSGRVDCDCNLEQLFVSISCLTKELIVGVVYIPPRSDVTVYNMHCASVEEILGGRADCSVAIFGDYNLPNVCWSNDEFGVTVDSPPSHPARLVAESFAYLGLSQLNTVPNDRGVFLDLLFSNVISLTTERAIDLLSRNSIHHTAFISQFTTVVEETYVNYSFSTPNFKIGDYASINNYLASIDWEHLFSGLEIDDAVNQFYSVIYTAVNRFVPSKICRSSSFPIWFSGHLKRLILQKKKAHKKFIQSRSADDYRVFSRLRSQCKSVSEECYRLYVRELEVSICGDSNKFWKYVNDSKSSSRLPGKMFLDNRFAVNGPSVVDLFADYFSTVYSDAAYVLPEFEPKRHVNFTPTPVSMLDIYTDIDRLKPKFTTGPDGVPSFFLKRCVSTLAIPLHHLFNLSLSTGKFPDFWKSSFLSVIHKSGDRSEVGNYRAVCIQSEMAKLLDQRMSLMLSNAFCDYIEPQQHGFMRGRSTVTNLLSYQCNILSSLEQRSQVDSVYTDVAKAFDRVNHEILLYKLEKIGSDRLFIRWLRSFLSDRIQWVRIDGYLSRAINVTSGVPQGSHCGPILFNLFIDDVCSQLRHSEFSFFADDLKVYRTIRSFEDCQMLQSDIYRLCEWFRVNGLSLNHDKCLSITFHRTKNPVLYVYSVDGCLVKRVTEVNDLGVLFSSDMSFSKHIDSVVAKAFKLLGFVTRFSRPFSINTFRFLYCALVRPSLEYASVVWSPYYQCDIDRLEKIQKKFLMTCHFRNGGRRLDYSYTSMSRQLSLAPLKLRRHNSDMCFLYKLVNGMVSCGFLSEQLVVHPGSRTRQRVFFRLGFHATNYAFYSPFARICRDFNNSNLQLHHTSLNSFRRALPNNL